MKKEIIIPLITLLIGTVVGSGAISQYFQHELDQKQYQLEASEKILNLYEKQREIWLEMAPIREEIDDLYKEVFSGEKKASREKSDHVERLEEEIKQHIHLYRQIERKLAILEDRPYKDPFPVPKPVTNLKFKLDP